MGVGTDAFEHVVDAKEDMVGALVQWIKLPAWKVEIAVRAPLWLLSFNETKCFFSAYL